MMLVFPSLAPSPGVADLTINLAARQTQVNRLGPDLLSSTAAFQVDEADTMRVEVISNLGNLSTAIVGPGGEIVNEATIGGFGGVYAAVSGGSASSFLITPADQPGYHYVYSLPSLGEGTYSVQFAASPDLATDVAVITEVVTDSPLAPPCSPQNPSSQPALWLS